MPEVDKDGKLNQRPLDFQVTEDGQVLIYLNGEIFMTMKGKAAENLVAKLEGAGGRVDAGRNEVSEISLAERQDVVRIIEAAWADALYPGDNKITLYPESNFDEDIEINRGFTGKHWREISLETLIANRDYLPRFTIEGLHFYLPAYMIASILHYETVDVLSSNTVYQFSPPDYESSQEIVPYPYTPVTEEVFQERVVDFNRLVDGFSAQQKAAIRTFLELCEKLGYYDFEFDPTGLRALNYWRQNG